MLTSNPAKFFLPFKEEKRTRTRAMGEEKAERNTEDRNRKWELASTARMRPFVPGLFLGNVEASYKQEMLRENRINAIVSLTEARWVWWNSPTRAAGVPEHRHKWVQCADSSTEDLLAQMGDICDFIDQMASPVLSSSEHSLESNDSVILIHCDLGICRSPTVIIAYLVRKYRMKREDMLAFVRSKQKVKPSANLVSFNSKSGRM